MDSDTSWYDKGQKHSRNQPSVSGIQCGRPPDEPSEEKPDTKDIEAVCLVDDEDDAEEAVNSFHNLTRKKIMLPLTGVEIQEECQFIEAIKQFKTILEEKVEVLTLRRNLKEILYKYLLFFATKHERIGILYKDQYLDVMEDVLLFYCDVIKEFLRERRGKRTKVIQEARRMKILLRNCLLKKMDRILYVLLKVRLAPEIEELRLLWGDVYMYFLTKVPHKHTDDDILRVFIAFQKFKTIRTKSEVPMIDKLMLGVCKKTMEELSWVPCLGDIMDKMKRNRLFTVRDMVARYMEYYREKRRRTECFGTEDVDENPEVVSNNQMRRLDLPSSFSTAPSTSASSGASVAQIFAERRKGIRLSVLDMAAQSDTQMDQVSSEFTLFGDDVGKSESPEDPIVVLDDEEDDDVIVVYDNLQTVITIDDDEEDGPVLTQPTKSPPPPRDALSPNKMFLPPEPPVEYQSPNQLEQSSTSLAQSTVTSDVSSSIALMDADSQLLPSCSTIVARQISSIEPSEVEAHPFGQKEKTDTSTHNILPVDNSSSNIMEVDNPLPPANSINAEHPESEMTLSTQNLPLGENSSTHKEKTDTSPIPRSSPSPSGLMEVDNSVAPNNFTTIENSVPESKSTPKEVLPFKLNILPIEKLVTKKVQTLDAQISTRQVKEVDNSLIITINSLPSKVPTSNIQALGEQQSKQLVLEKSSEEPRQSMETIPSVPKEKTYPPNDQAKLVSSPTRLEENIEESAKHIQNMVLDSVEMLLPNKLLESQISLPKTIPEAFSADKLSPKNLDTDSQKESQLVQPVEKRGEFTKQSKVTEKLMLEEVSEKTFEYDSLNQTGKSDSVMEIDTTSNNSVKLGSNINSQMDKEIASLANTTSVSPLINQHDNVVEASVSFTMKLPEANRIGVLPSSKIPSDLDDSPDSSPNKNPEKSERPHKESETSYISSPSYESIDKTQAKKHFESWKHPERKSSSNEIDTSDTSTEISTSSNETNEQATAESSVSTSREACDEPELTSSLESSESSTSSLTEYCEIQVEESTRSDDLKNVKGLSEIDENMTREIPFDSLMPESNHTIASGPEPCDQTLEVSGPPNKTINYSNITECFPKFVEELSIEDIGTSQSEDLTCPAEDLGLSTIDLVPDTENANDVIVVKCRLIESLKDEENTASGTETVAFSTDEVLTSSNEAIALLVTYPPSQEESQHFLMCDANLTLSSDPHAFSINEIPPIGDDGASSADEHSDQASVDNRTVLHPRSKSLEGPLLLSGSQPYTPQSSPSTRINTVKQDVNRFDEVSNAVESCLTYSGSLSHEASSLPQDPSITKVKRLSGSLRSAKPLALPKIANKVTKRRKSETSLSSLKPRRNSFDLPKGGIYGLVGMSDTKVYDKTFNNAVEDFRENLSQSVTSATRVTPQEVDKITQLPFKYSQESWTGRPQQIPDMSQNIPSSNVSAKLLEPLEKTHVQLEDSLLSPEISHPEFILPQQTLQVSKPDMSIVNASDKQLNSLMYPERFSENKLDELYLKEYGNTGSQQNTGLSPQKVHSKRRYSQEALSPVRSLKIYAKDKSVKDLSQFKDRDASLKSYKSLIKSVSKRRTSVLRDLENPSRKEEEFVPPSTKPKTLEDTSQKKDPNDLAKEISLNGNAFDYNDLFNNGLEGPIGKPMVGKEGEDNWDIDNDTIENPMEATVSGTISVKPDSQLYKARKGTVSPLKSSVSILKRSTISKETDSVPEQKSPEKNKNSLTSTAESGLYANENGLENFQSHMNTRRQHLYLDDGRGDMKVRLTPIDVESYQRKLNHENEMKKKQMYLANEIKRKQQIQLSLAREMREKQQQSLQRDQILIQINSKKSEYPSRINNNWSAKARFPPHTNAENKANSVQDKRPKPSENLEINPNLLHLEKNGSEVFSTEEFSTSRSSEDVRNVLNQHYVFENTEEAPYLSLSNALIGGSIYSSGVTFKDNPFVGQDHDSTRNSTSSASPSQPGKYLPSDYVPGTKQTGVLAYPQDNSPLIAKELRSVTAPAKAKSAYSNAHTLSADKVQPSAQRYSDSALNSHSGLYYDQTNLRLPDISTLKDPRRKNHTSTSEDCATEGSYASQNSNGNFMPSIEMMPIDSSAIVTQSHTDGHSNINIPNPILLPSYNSVPFQNIPTYSSTVENLPHMPIPNQLQIETSPNVSQATTTVPLPQDQEKLQTPKVEESNSTETLQESLQKTQLPPKKRKLIEDEELAIYIQKFKEEKERKKKLEENISYPAQRQMSIADLQRDIPKVKTLAARKLYPEGTAYPDQNYYEYPQGYDQYNDFNDYRNKRSIMNVYINGVRECSANYPLCLMVGTVHTCVNNQAESENASQTRPPPPEIPQYAELTTPAQNLLNMQKTVIPDVASRQIAEPPPARPKRSRKTGACSGEAPPAKRGRGRPRKNVN